MVKLAIVYDRVNKWGGAERVLLALHEIWPDAPLYTAVYDKQHASWADVFQVHPSFLQYVPFAKRHHELYPWLTPMAFESFTWDGYDAVLSVTSAEAKDIITKPGTVHICYCLTPTRYLWSARADYEQSGIAGRILGTLSPTLRAWDRVAASRPDAYIAISESVAGRIQTYYRRKVLRVIYPPVDTDKFTAAGKSTKPKEPYFLCVGRFVPYKRIDLVIAAFNRLGWKLKIIGSGMLESTLKKQAGRTIEFVGGDLTDSELVSYYQKCTAFVFAGDEDFGIAAVEAAACGKPVVCPRGTGMAETVIDGQTGVLYNQQTVASLIPALRKIRKGWYDSRLCRQNALRFGEKRFKEDMQHTVLSLTHI